jgi:hypothetical protein
MVLFHFMWARRETRPGNGLAPVQVFNAVPSPPFSAPAELACPITTQHGAHCLLMASPFDQFRLRQPRRPEVPSKDGSGRLNLRWSLRPFSDLFCAAHAKGKSPSLVLEHKR